MPAQGATGSDRRRKQHKPVAEIIHAAFGVTRGAADTTRRSTGRPAPRRRPSTSRNRSEAGAGGYQRSYTRPASALDLVFPGYGSVPLDQSGQRFPGQRVTRSQRRRGQRIVGEYQRQQNIVEQARGTSPGGGRVTDRELNSLTPARRKQVLKIAKQGYRATHPGGVIPTATRLVDRSAEGFGKLLDQGVRAQAGATAGSSGLPGVPLIATARAPKIGGHVPGKGERTIVGNAGRDLTHFALGAPLALYALGEAGVQATPIPGVKKSNTKHAKRIYKAIKETDPLALALQGRFKEAGKSAERDPLFAALDAGLLYGAIGRGIGAVSRETTGGAVGGTKREPLVIEGQEFPRRYSKNIITKQGQKAVERRVETHGMTKGAKQRHLTRAANTFADQLASRRAVDREMGILEDRANAPDVIGSRRRLPGIEVRPGQRARVALTTQSFPNLRYTVGGLTSKGKRGTRNIVSLVAEGSAAPHTLLRDLKAERARIEHVYQTELRGTRKPARTPNRKTARDLDRAISHLTKNPHLLPAVVESSRRYAHDSNKLEQRLIQLGLLDAEQALRAKLTPVAVRELGAAVSREPLKAARKRAAAVNKVAKQTQRDVNRRTTSLEKQLAVAQNELKTIYRESSAVPGLKYGRDFRIRDLKVKVAETKAALSESKRTGRDEIRSAKANAARVQAGVNRLDRRGVISVGGRKLETSEMIAHLERKGVDLADVAFVTHRPDVRGPKSFLQSYRLSRTGLGEGRRTGEAARTGAAHLDYQALIENRARLTGIANRAAFHDQLVTNYGQKRPDGNYFTPEEARSAAANGLTDSHGNRIPNAVELVPVTAFPGKASGDRLQRILSGQDPVDLTGDLEDFGLKAFDELSKVEGNKRNVVLVPKVQYEAVREQLAAASGTGAKAMQLLTQQFRGTVLPLSVRWLAGNTIEAVLRLVVNGVAPHDNAIGHRLLREINRVDDEAYRNFMAVALQGTLYGSRGRAPVRRAEAFFDTRFEKPAMAAAYIRRHSPLAPAFDAIRGTQDAVFALNKAFEREAQITALGKFAREEMQAFTGSWIKAMTVHDGALMDLVHGLRNTPKQQQAAHYIDDVLGQYSKFSPFTRSIINNYAPFLPWYLNAVKFVYHTLPVKHPAKAALIASVERTMDEDFRRRESQYKKFPGLRYTIERQDSGLVDIGHYTPFGAFLDIESVTSVLLPQVEFIGRLAGRDFAFQPLTGPNHETVGPGDPKAFLLALSSVLEAYVPGLLLARRLREHGGTPYNTSTIWAPRTKPGKDYFSSFERIFNPFRPTYLHGKRVKGGAPGVGALSAREVEALQNSISGGPTLSQQEIEALQEALSGGG